MRFERMSIVCAIIFGTSSLAFAQATVSDVDWNDPSLMMAMGQIEKEKVKGLESASPYAASQLPVSLPILGLPLPDKTASVKSLESLASGQAAALYKYDRNKGYWYSQLSRGKDITVLVQGSRLSEGDPNPLQPEEISFQFLAEDGSSKPTEVVASFKRFQVRYSVTVTCRKVDDPRCSQEAAVRTLISSLKVLGGKQ